MFAETVMKHSDQYFYSSVNAKEGISIKENMMKLKKCRKNLKQRIKLKKID